MALILAFPLARRRGLIRKQGARLASLPEHEAEKHLAYLLRQQREALERKGVDSDAVAEDVAALELAIRCEIMLKGLSFGGAA